MTRTCSVVLLAVALLLGGASSSAANLLHCPRVVFAPCLPCCPGLLCRIPLLVRCVRVAPPAPVVVTRPILVAPPTVVSPLPTVQAPPAFPPAPIVSVPSALPPTVVLPAPAAPLTHQQFAQVFKPLPGKYEVTLLHPGNKCPVSVCFTLPEGCPRVVVNRRDLVFDYGRHDVHIRFQIGGRVKVTTR